MLRYSSFAGKSPQSILALCKDNHCKTLGSGSSRIVIKISNKRVIKVALNDAGRAQNKREAFLTDKYLELNLFANALYYEGNYNWIISQYANKASIKEIFLFLRDNNSKIRKMGITDLVDTDHYPLKEHFGKIKSRVVIIDYGASRSIIDRYY